MEDPRWKKPSSGHAAVVERSASFSREKDGSGGSFSIVFSAKWVRVTTPIGEGAFSRVYEGVYTNPETTEDSIVAVKILKKDMLKRRSDCLRFIKEAKIMTKISHRHIAACYGIGKYDDDDALNPGSLFIVQELVRGGNLLHRVYKQMLNRQKCVYTSQEALAWMVHVAEGMQYLHNVSDSKPMIIHRDLKLENIMLSPEASGTIAKLVDFGLHKVIDDRIKKVVKRVVSEANLGGSRLSRSRGMEEADKDDELEVALAEQRAQAAAAGGSATTTRFSPLRRGGSRLTLESSMESHPEGEEEEQEEAAAPNMNGAASPRSPLPSPLSRQAAASPVGSAAPTASTSTPALEGGSDADPMSKVRRAPQRTSSMQKLMAKMKEIKLRVTGKLGDGSATPTTPTPSSPTSSALPSVSFDSAQPAAGAAAACSSPQVDRIARNEALLNRIIQEQSVSRQGSSSPVMDDLGVLDGAGGQQQQQQRRAPPRRAITWVNEVRYNLTEAVGSWAYMAPEVVLGQPYNEKVDVFSFGVILFEVLNRKLMLVDEIKSDPRKDAQAYAARVARGFRPDIPRHWPPQLADLIRACWAQDPHVRPNFTAVLDVLHEINASAQVAKLDVAYWSRGSIFI